MTFSDAEEDQPSAMQNGTSMPNGAGPSTPNEVRPSTNESQASCTNSSTNTNTNIKAEDSRAPTEAKLIPSSSNTPSVSNHSSTETSSASISCAVSGTGSSANSIETSVSQDCAVNAASSSQPINGEASGLSFEPASLQLNAESVVGDAGNSMKGLEAEKVMEKLQQIHGYIQQTAAAMQALEHEGNLGMQDCLLEQFEAIYNSLQSQENECIEILSKSLLFNLAESHPSENADEPNAPQRESGSESLGVVRPLNEEGGRPPTMLDNLARHESEQVQLSERLRESLVRREELMARYEATRERLNNLKRQRLGYVHEERRLLQSVGAPENPYDDPIPGAENWSLSQLESALTDFRGLRNKVEHLHQAYTAKLQGTDENDCEGRAEVQCKIDHILSKKRQIGSALAQIGELILAKRERQEVESALSSLPPSEPANASASPASGPAENVLTQKTILVPSEGTVDQEMSEGAVGMSPSARDILAKQQHLQSLKDQLVSMKRLLKVTQEAMPMDGEDDIEPLPGFSSLGNADDVEGSDLVEDAERGEVQEESAVIGGTIVGVNGEVIHLSDSERRNPEVVSKFQQLSSAKNRLAKMEEVMMKIAEARHTGMSLTDVLTPENMDILNEEDGNVFEQPESTPPLDFRLGSTERGVDDQAEASSDVLRTAHRIQREVGIILNATPPPPSVKRNPVSRGQEKSASGRPEWEGEREISAMQFHLKKKTPGIPPVNEGHKVGKEKEAVKKQTRDLLNESGGGDPRLLEVLTLQEELKEKKNALEALMRRMGKSSSFTLDNISDNISENVSDGNSETMEKPSASWGAASRHHPRYSSSDRARGNDQDEEFCLGYGAGHPSLNALPRQFSGPRLPPDAKNRNRANPQKMPHNQDNHFSVNNLIGSVPKSVRPKHNRIPAGNVPTPSWENVASPNVPSSQNLNPNKVQNTVTSALTQLAQVQETINSLYGELRAADISTRQQPQAEVPVLNPFMNNTMVPQPQFNAAPQNLMPNYCVSPLPNTQGRGDLGTPNQVLSGLQQCFSQLYLHSLEIQSLSKHLQMIDQREKSLSPPSQPRGGKRLEFLDRRGERLAPGVRRVNENVSPDFPPPPRFSLPPTRYDERGPRNGVSNPLYSRLTNQPILDFLPMGVDEEVDLEFGNKNFFPPFDGSGPDEGDPSAADLLLDSSSHFPLQAEELSQSLPQEDLPWSNAASPQTQPQPSDVLNNQVLPGTRANNYWDNFRSYSRQNPLSTSAKCNTGEPVSLSGSSTPARGGPLSNSRSRIQPSTSFEIKNRPLNAVPCSNHSINRASDKNSSSSRSQNQGGARARYSHHSNGRRPAAANAQYQYNLASPPTQGIPSENRKRNNRPDLRPSYAPQSSFSQLESNPSQVCVTADGHLIGANASLPVNSNISSRRYPRERGERAPRNSEGGCSDYCASHNTNMGCENTTSHEDLSTSETFSQVVREAESLMQKHSQQPQFLLQLFHHASKITSNTDQQVALELLRELSYQRQQNYIQHNRWTSTSSVTHSDNFNFPAPIGDTNYRNITRFSNKNSRSVRGISGSDASESGITSDEEDTKALYQMVKNLTPTSSSVGVYPPLRSSPQAFSDPSNHPSSVGVSPIHVSNSLAQNPPPQLYSHKAFSKDMINIVSPAANKPRGKSENQHQVNKMPRRKQEVETPVRNYIPSSTSCDSPSAHSNSLATPSTKSNSKAPPADSPHSPLAEKHNNRRQMRKSPRRNLKAAEEKSNFCSSKNAKKNWTPRGLPSSSNDVPQEPGSGFEAMVSASLREVLVCFESADYSQASTSQVLDSLLHSIMKQVQFYSSTLGFSSNFASSIDAQLKATLRSFYGRTMPAIRQELAAAVTQVLIQEYCSLFLQHDSDVDARPGAAPPADSNLVNDVRATTRPDPEPNMRTMTPQFNKQTSGGSSSSLFGPPESVLKQGRASSTAWSFSPVLQAEGGAVGGGGREMGLSHPREEDCGKAESMNLKGKGAISKNSGPASGKGPVPAPAPTQPDEGAANLNSLSRDSPLPEAPSTFPESWVMQRASSNASDVEGGAFAFPEGASSSSPFLRDDLRGRDASTPERNDAEADQDEHARKNNDFLNVSLPVHDLAEADQSQDPIPADCVESSMENDHYEAAAAPFPQAASQELKEFTLRFATKKKEIPEQGLDEVPTRLLSAGEGAAPSSVMLNGEGGSEGALAPHRYGPFPLPVSPPMSQTDGEQKAASHLGAEASSGKGG